MNYDKLQAATVINNNNNNSNNNSSRIKDASRLGPRGKRQENPPKGAKNCTKINKEKMQRRET